MTLGWQMGNEIARTVLIPISVLIAFLGFRHDDVSQARAVRADLEQQRLSARDAFVLEAARSVMSEPDCARAIKRATYLVRLFHDRLPDDFARPVPTFFSRCRLDRKTNRLVALPDKSGCPTPEPIDARLFTFPKGTTGSIFGRPTTSTLQRPIDISKLFEGLASKPN